MPAQADFVPDTRQANLPSTPLEVPRLSQAVLNIEDKRRSNPLTWKGQFSPQLVEAHLRCYGVEGCLVLDPFAGSGTVLHESLLAGMRAIGVEINPAAVILSRLYAYASVEPGLRRQIVEGIDSAIRHRESAAPDGLTLFPTAPIDPSEALLALLAEQPPESLERDVIEALVIQCDLFRAPSWTDVLRRWRELKRLLLSLPHAATAPVVHMADARALPVPEQSIDLVFTSPPYINVFNYHQQYRASVEAVGWNVLPIAQSEIGSNRKFRSNRLLTVVQYCLDMALCLLELRRVLRPEGRAIFVVGRESNVRKTAFFNGAILRTLATSVAGFNTVLAQERVFVNRFGTSIYEDILHFRTVGNDRLPVRDDAVSAARELAAAVLDEARARVLEKDILDDLDDAISQASQVEPSALLSAQKSTAVVSAARALTRHV